MTKNRYSDIKAIVTNIEGTITYPSFMKEVLIPYVSSRLLDYVWDYEPDLAEYLDGVRKAENNPSLNTEEIIEVLLRYISEGENPYTLQYLQSLILRQGYEDREIQSFIYEDTLRAIKRWRDQGIYLYVYSSFSITEQRLFFSNTQAGDISKSFDKLFDMQTGDKKQTDSYNKIAASIGVQNSCILFLTDNVEDAVTASNTGMEVIVMDRQACLTNAYGRRIEQDFDNILPETVPA